MAKSQMYGASYKIIGIILLVASILIAAAGSLDPNAIIGVFNNIIANPIPYAASFILAIIGGWLLTKMY